jgi:hypothetical protein
LFGKSEAWDTATVEVARLVKPASATVTILLDNMRMRFSPYDALRPSDAAIRSGKRRLALRVRVSVDCMIRPPEQKPGTRVKAHNETVDAISPTPYIVSRFAWMREDDPTDFTLKSGQSARAFNSLAAFCRSGPARSVFVRNIPRLEEFIRHGLNSCCNVAGWTGRQ